MYARHIQQELDDVLDIPEDAIAEGRIDWGDKFPTGFLATPNKVIIDENGPDNSWDDGKCGTLFDGFSIVAIETWCSSLTPGICLHQCTLPYAHDRRDRLERGAAHGGRHVLLESGDRGRARC